MRVADGPAVVGHNIGNLVLANSLALDLDQLEGSFLGVDLVADVSALNIVKHAEELARLLNAHNILEPNREPMIAADLVVDLDHAFLVLHDFNHLIVAHRVLEPLLQKDCERDALSELVRAGARPRSVDAVKLAQHPVVRCIDSLQMLLKSSCLRRASQYSLPLPSLTTKIYINNS